MRLQAIGSRAITTGRNRFQFRRSLPASISALKNRKPQRPSFFVRAFEQPSSPSDRQMQVLALRERIHAIPIQVGYERFSKARLGPEDTKLILGDKDWDEIKYPKSLDGIRDWKGKRNQAKFRDGDGVASPHIIWTRLFLEHWLMKSPALAPHIQSVTRDAIFTYLRGVAKSKSFSTNYALFNAFSISKLMGIPMPILEIQAKLFFDYVVLDAEFNMEPPNKYNQFDEPQPCPCIALDFLQDLAECTEQGTLMFLVSGSYKFLWDTYFQEIQRYAINILGEDGEKLAPKLKDPNVFVIGAQPKLKRGKFHFVEDGPAVPGLQASGECETPLTVGIGKLALLLEAAYRGDFSIYDMEVGVDCAATDYYPWFLGNRKTRYWMNPSPAQNKIFATLNQRERLGVQPRYSPGQEAWHKMPPKAHENRWAALNAHRIAIIEKKVLEYDETQRDS